MGNQNLREFAYEIATFSMKSNSKISKNMKAGGKLSSGCKNVPPEWGQEIQPIRAADCFYSEPAMKIT
jgi:hypothetical protein